MRLVSLGIILLILWLAGCQQQVRVSQPAGWRVLAFEMTAIGEPTQYLKVDLSSCEIKGERLVRGQTMKTTVRGNQQGRVILVEWMDSAGNRRTDAPVEVNDQGRFLQSLQKSYYVGMNFPSEQMIRSRLGNNFTPTSYCGRSAYEIRRSGQIEVIDAQTGIRLAVYRLPEKTTVWALRSAKWTLKKDSKVGVYEIVCSP